VVEVKVEAIRMSLMSPGHQVVILKDVDAERFLPIFIGKPEGDAIILALREEDLSRPLTHDLALLILDSLKARVGHVLINDLRNNHFQALVVLNTGDKEITVDARPSDAIAIAVRAGCPIFVDQDVMDAAGVVPQLGENASGDMSAFEDFLDTLNLDDLDK
jgi:bifunctional DNase/RNase